jgi:prepilin-type N-terminal cleavage/methylation domain-containing protein
MYTKREAFTMIELIFVIVILGILGAVAIPKLSGIKDDAQLANASENVCVNLKGNYLAYSVRHGGSLEDFNISKYLNLTSSDWHSEATANSIDGTTSVISKTRGLIPYNDASGTITPFASIPKNNIYLYFLDGNTTASKTYGCFIGNKASYSKTANDLRDLMANGSNYL